MITKITDQVENARESQSTNLVSLWKLGIDPVKTVVGAGIQALVKKLELAHPEYIISELEKRIYNLIFNFLT